MIMNCVFKRFFLQFFVIVVAKYQIEKCVKQDEEEGKRIQRKNKKA